MVANGPTIALDAMGGDNAPEIVIRGAAIALERFPDVRFLVFGAGETLTKLVAKDKVLSKAVELREASSVISADAKPCLLYTSPSPRDRQKSRMPSSA